MPMIVVTAAVGTILILGGPSNSGVCSRCITPFGGVPIYSNEILYVTQPVSGWEVPWGFYTVNGETYTFKPTDFFGYLTQFSEGDLEADLTTSAIPATWGFGVPDGRLTSDDFFYFLWLYSIPP